MQLRNTMPALIAASVFLFSCTKKDIPSEQVPSGFDQSIAKSNQNDQSTYYGPVVQMGNGHIRSFGVLEKQTDKPIAVGFEMAANSLHGLPHGHDGDHHGAHYLVKLHPKVQSSTIFDHLVADWNPHGHQPFFYLSAHFDFHFYMMSLADRLQITPANAAQGYMDPIPGHLPADYIGPLPDSFEPEMGSHCVDKDAPEIPFPWNPYPTPFTHTFIYGLYNGKVNFYEPMATHAYLIGSQSGTFNIKQPAKFNKNGYYPKKYSITKSSNGTRTVVLSDFEYRTAG